MREDTPSRTAAWVAAARGLGALLPPAARLVDDPYGVAFASPRLARAIDSAGAKALLVIPGMRHWVVYMQVRTRVIDDAVRAFLAGGGRQVVVLGAGYDTRALRLGLDAVWEIDHPATQGHKQRVLDRLGARSPAHYVTWNFETDPLDDLPAALAAAGHDRARPTFTIWEGVTMYLTEGAIDASLRAIHAFSAPGSQLAMTYFSKDRLAKPSLATRALQTLVRGAGEPWRWGWDAGALPGFLAERDFTLARDVAMAEAGRALFSAAGAADYADLLGDSEDRRIALIRRAAQDGESIAIVNR